jgi:sigma-B regulation protein RsbU (phosphoserine phosphatase)
LLHLREQLNLAREIQSRLLPDENPDVPGFDVAGTSIPAQTVGGDFYDIVQVDPATFVFWVGDVSGKGLPASLTMANTQATLRAHAMSGRSAADCAKNSNELLCRYTPKGTFVTLLLATLDVETGSVRYCNAGHCRPLLLRADGSFTPLEHNDLVLGFKNDYPYTSAATVMQPGDLIVVYSDGVNEAMNADRDQYGDDRVVEIMKRCQSRPAEEVVGEIVVSVREHSIGQEQSDDITLLALKRK